MRRIRIGIIGAGAATEWAVLPALSGPDALSPPDNGAWWTRRPTLHADIQYQPPARPEVVALADADADRLQRVAVAARVPASYTDWRQMLREVPLDALLCMPAPEAAPDLLKEVLSAGHGNLPPIYCDGLPAVSVEASRVIRQRATGLIPRLHMGLPLRQALAHREAFRCIQRGDIGDVTAVQARWNNAFKPAGAVGDGAARAASYGAIDLMLSLAAGDGRGSAVPRSVTAVQRGGTVSLLLEAAPGVSLTALFAGTDPWSTSLPRLEVCGTEGRYLVCEAGRRLWLHRPRQPATMIEPPGLAVHLSAANLSGVAEDVKTFLAGSAEPAGILEDEPGAWPAWLEGPVRALQVLEAIESSLEMGCAVPIAPLPAALPSRQPDSTDASSTRKRPSRDAATLPLQLH